VRILSSVLLSIENRFLNCCSVAFLKFSFYFNFWRSFIDQLFLIYKFDAIHIHDLPLAKVGHEFSQKHRIPFILDLHENWPELLRMSTHTQTIIGKLLSSYKQWKNYEREFCIKADHIIVVVDEAKDRLIRLGLSPNKISIVSNTLNFNHFRAPSSLPDDEYITLMYAGGINKHRGLQYVIKGLKHLTQLTKPIRFWVIGTGSYIYELKKIALQHEVENHVNFVGWKNFKEMQIYFGKADICLIPHIKSPHTDSTIPHKLFQYMHSGKPTIASNCLPIERILKNTNSGLVYAYNDAKQFAECVIQMIENTESAKEMQQNGIKSVKEIYNWENDSEVLVKIYS
jgi:glycosyltransferase involved in cell wall biosynthesis